LVSARGDGIREVKVTPPLAWSPPLRGIRFAPMPPARTVATLLAAASLAAAGPTVALAQDDGGAGDQQYQDPFGSSQTQTAPSKTTSSKKKTKKNGLSQTPNLGSSETAGASEGSTTTGTAGAEGTSELPRTGGDTVPVALIGLALLLCGIGLRLRMADERP
jgi:hypothetical protein